MQNKGITIHSDNVCRPLVTTQERRQRDAQEEGVAVQFFGRAQY